MFLRFVRAYAIRLSLLLLTSAASVALISAKVPKCLQNGTCPTGHTCLLDSDCKTWNKNCQSCSWTSGLQCVKC